MDFQPSEALLNFFKPYPVQQSGKGEIITYSDDVQEYVYCSQDGFVKSYSLTDEGETNIYAVTAPKTIFPLPLIIPAITGRQYKKPFNPVYYEAMSKLTFQKAPLQDMARYTGNNSDVVKALLEQVMHENGLFARRIDNLTRRSAREKIVHLLVELSERYGSNKDGVITISMPLTHQTIADFEALARETVTRELAGLKEEGLIDFKGSRTVILRHEQLIGSIN